VARIFDVSGEVGCLVLEDLGDRSLEGALEGAASGAEGRGLLEAAVRLAASVAVRGTPVLERSDRRDGPVLDSVRFRFEMDFFIEHYAEGLLGRRKVSNLVHGALHALADAAAASPTHVLCHRDFHSRNLMLVPTGELAMVDIQDARLGPDSYDLASLLRDAYVDIDESWVQPLVDLYGDLAEPQGASDFRRRFDIVAAQRMIKALGTFGFQVRAGNRRYSTAIPRTVHRLRALLPLRDETRPAHEALVAAGLLDLDA
jgi:aminoglycoside/choline kinase family phosphotransferase